jgi:hypothetical protein
LRPEPTTPPTSNMATTPSIKNLLDLPVEILSEIVKLLIPEYDERCLLTEHQRSVQQRGPPTEQHDGEWYGIGEEEEDEEVEVEIQTSDEEIEEENGERREWDEGTEAETDTTTRPCKRRKTQEAEPSSPPSHIPLSPSHPPSPSHFTHTFTPVTSPPSSASCPSISSHASQQEQPAYQATSASQAASTHTSQAASSHASPSASAHAPHPASLLDIPPQLPGSQPAHASQSASMFDTQESPTQDTVHLDFAFSGTRSKRAGAKAFRCTPLCACRLVCRGTKDVVDGLLYMQLMQEASINPPPPVGFRFFRATLIRSSNLFLHNACAPNQVILGTYTPHVGVHLPSFGVLQVPILLGILIIEKNSTPGFYSQTKSPSIILSLSTD